ncbi:hypothetical protein CYMTET_25129 [Cymbomonas tetramitiformis]|uniref:Uncharacterized protein n=1 Tax=Cymbomonas tetramitiformis TaxID=36881 RepID=A0AAE0FUT5_9CHLO|nr:hypothetical protein CYMTET_25129 [Cymbomonas tetramitiformis]
MGPFQMYLREQKAAASVVAPQWDGFSPDGFWRQEAGFVSVGGEATLEWCLPVVSEPPAHSPPPSVESEEEWTGPPNPFCPPVTRTFADFIQSTGVALEAPDEPAASMNLLSAVEAPERVIDYEPAAYATSDDDDGDASGAPPRPRSPDCGGFAG